MRDYDISHLVEVHQFMALSKSRTMVLLNYSQSDLGWWPRRFWLVPNQLGCTLLISSEATKLHVGLPLFSIIINTRGPNDKLLSVKHTFLWAKRVMRGLLMHLPPWFWLAAEISNNFAWPMRNWGSLRIPFSMPKLAQICTCSLCSSVVLEILFLVKTRT